MFDVLSDIPVDLGKCWLMLNSNGLRQQGVPASLGLSPYRRPILTVGVEVAAFDTERRPIAVVTIFGTECFRSPWQLKPFGLPSVLCSVPYQVSDVGVARH